MVWARGKNSVCMKIFILYSVGHFIYNIKIWVGEMVEVNLKIV